MKPVAKLKYTYIYYTLFNYFINEFGFSLLHQRNNYGETMLLTVCILFLKKNCIPLAWYSFILTDFLKKEGVGKNSKNKKKESILEATSIRKLVTSQ